MSKPPDAIEPLIAQLLKELGEDAYREGLERTPERVEKALRYLTAGYRMDVRETLNDALADPLDERDLSAAQPGDAAELRKALDALLAAAKTVDEGGTLQNEEALRALGYLGN